MKYHYHNTCTIGRTFFFYVREIVNKYKKGACMYIAEICMEGADFVTARLN